MMEPVFNDNLHSKQIRSPLPRALIASMKQVLSTLKAGGECPIFWRNFSKQYKKITCIELEPSKYGYSSVLDMLEYMAECGECEMLNIENKGVCVTSLKVHSDDINVDLTMLDLPWTETGILPVGAVEDDKLDQQCVEIIEGFPLNVQVTEVVNMDKIWFCLFTMLDEREELMNELNTFYTKCKGKSWKVPDVSYCWGGRLMAAIYKSEGYHRVIVRRVLKNEMISVLYVDYGTIDKVKLNDMRLLHKKFLYLPAQAIPARMWGVKDIAGKEGEAKQRLVQLISDSVFGLLGTVMAGVTVGLNDRRKGGAVDDEGRLALWLVDAELSSSHGDVFNEILVIEGLAEWNLKDITRMISQYGGEISSSDEDVDAVDLVLDIMEQIKACSKEKTSARNDKYDCSKTVKIITVDDSSSDEIDTVETLSETAPSISPFVTEIDTLETLSETVPSVRPIVKKCFKVREGWYCGPSPPVASQAVKITYSEFGGCRVEQIDMNK